LRLTLNIMKNSIIILLLTFIILSGCTSIYEDDYEPYIGIYYLIAPGPYGSYETRPLYDKYSNERDLLICISDSKAMLKGRSGNKLEFTIFTSSGESETYDLDDTDIVGFNRTGDGSPGYHYFKRIFPKSTLSPTPNNEVIEINSNIDTIYFQYKSASFPRMIITDTLNYRSILLPEI